MIVITRPDITEEELAHIRERVESLGLKAHISRGEHRTIIGCVGDETALAEVPLLALPGVESVTPVLTAVQARVARVRRDARRNDRRRDREPATHSADGDQRHRRAVLRRGNARCCSRPRTPCAHAGATMLRGGAYKPRTSPYAFQGMGEAALELLAAARAETGLPVVTEVMDTRQVDTVRRYADMLQIGARNMQNFALLAEVGRSAEARAAQARPLGHDQGAADGGRVRHGERQSRRRCCASAASAPSRPRRATPSTSPRFRCSRRRRICR